MATTINASTSGLIETSDGTALLDLQTGGTTALRVNASQAIGVGSTPSFGTTGQFLTSQGNAASPTWTTGGTGTVTSVSWTGGIVSIATATSTPAFTIAGTSGGIPYFSSGTTWASSAALTQYGVVYGGGAGAAPVATAAGTTGQFLGANTGAAPTWQTPSGGGSPGGSNTQVQYNSSGSFAGSANLTFTGSLLNVNAAATTPTNTPFVVKSANSSYAAIKAEGSPNTGFIIIGDNATATESFGTVGIGYSGAQFVLGGCVGPSNTTANTFNSTYATSANGAAFSISGPAGVFQWWNASAATTTAVGSAKSLTQVMTLDQNGYLLCGYTSSNGAYKLQVNSQIFATSAVIATSDARYKKDVIPVTDGLALVNKLNPVSFNWKPHQVHDFDTENTDVGFIAQEVQSALADSPYLSNIVKSNQTELPDGTKEDFLGIADGKLIPILVKAIQELTARLEALEAK